MPLRFVLTGLFVALMTAPVAFAEDGKSDLQRKAEEAFRYLTCSYIVETMKGREVEMAGLRHDGIELSRTIFDRNLFEIDVGERGAPLWLHRRAANFGLMLFQGSSDLDLETAYVSRVAIAAQTEAMRAMRAYLPSDESAASTDPLPLAAAAYQKRGCSELAEAVDG